MRRILLPLLMWLTTLCMGSGELWAQVDTKNVVTIGRNAIYFKDYVLAIQYFNTAVRYDPHAAEPYYYRAMAKLSLEDYAGAEADASLALDRNPFVYDAYYIRAIARHSLGQDRPAMEDYEMVLGNNPDHQGALHNSVVLSLALKDTVAARKHLDRLERFYPKYEPAYLMDAGIQMAQGDTVAAEQLIERALALDPYMAAALNARVGIAYSRGDYAEALRTADAALRSDSSSEAYTNRAVVRYKLDDLNGALDDYSEAIRLNPHNQVALYNRALLRNMVGDFNNALTDLNQLLQLSPDNYFAVLNHALLSSRLGDYEQAELDLDRIIEHYPTYAVAYAERATARRMQGDLSGARRDLNRLSQLLQQTTQPSGATAGALGQQEIDSAEEDPQQREREVRTEKDKNIRKFRLLIASDRTTSYDRLYMEDEQIRGRVQDRDVRVVLEPLYLPSYYMQEMGQLTQQAMVYEAGWLGLGTVGDRAVLLVRHHPPLSAAQVQLHMDELEQLRQQAMVSWAKVMDEITLKDYESALATLTMLHDSSPTDLAVAYVRGAVRLMAYLTQQETALMRQGDASEGGDITWTPRGSSVGSERIQRQAMTAAVEEDWLPLLQQIPDQPILHYSMGYLYYTVGRYADALAAHDRAIELDPNMGEAYFNRGLTYYAMGDKEQGDKDLSRAGERGYYRAYSIIKLMAQE